MKDLYKAISELYTEAARHDLCPSDGLCVSLIDRESGDALFCASGFADPIPLEKSERTGRIHRRIIAESGSISCVLSMHAGYAHGFAMLGSQITIDSRRNGGFFAEAVPCAGSEDELVAIINGGAKAALLSGVGAFVCTADPGKAAEAALALEYVARIEKTVSKLRGI